MRITLDRRQPHSPEPEPGTDPWLALLVAIDLAVVAGLADDWASAVTVFAAVLALFGAYIQSRR
ncbi:hypothetical protein ACWEKT_07400 [Nocardia takedensis]